MSLFHTIARQGSAALLALVALAAGQVQGQSDLAIELKEAQTTLTASLSRVSDLEARLTKAREQVNALAEALASANGESQQTREAYERIRVQMEGLGMAALDTTNTETNQRLLGALSDLRLLETQNKSLVDALYLLSVSSLEYAKAAGPVQGEPKMKFDEGLAAAEKILAKVQSSKTPEGDLDLQNARVVSLKEDAGILILNVGSRHGVHPGMPFSIYRQDKPVARALVVDVRNGICGAVLQELISKSEPVKVGDTGRVESVKS
ncbi:MAG: hypothetical protein ACAH88_04090 [Roseimicrobium sp.]